MSTVKARVDVSESPLFDRNFVTRVVTNTVTTGNFVEGFVMLCGTLTKVRRKKHTKTWTPVETSFYHD